MHPSAGTSQKVVKDVCTKFRGMKWSCHGALRVVLAEVNWDFLQIFQQKSAQLGYQRAKNKNITIWVMLPKLNSYVEK